MSLPLSSITVDNAIVNKNCVIGDSSTAQTNIGKGDDSYTSVGDGTFSLVSIGDGDGSSTTLGFGQNANVRIGNTTSRIGFYGTSPIVKQPTIVNPNNQTSEYVQEDVQSMVDSINSIINVLKNYGLIK